MIAFMLAVTVAASSAPTLDVDRSAIRRAVVQRHGGASVDHVIIHGEYALAAGRAAGSALTDGLHLTHAGWRVTCTLGAQPSATQLMSRCKFPEAIAVEISADEVAQSQAMQGSFGNAIIAQERAFASAKGPDRDQERARVQLLHQLNEQMRTGMITRRQAIQQWSQFRYSWMLP